MIPVAVTQRVSLESAERRDALDQRWTRFLLECGLNPLPVPNDARAALALLDAVRVAGVVLSGGNDLAAYGGDSPERDETELALLEWSLRRRSPVLGVCRGMQVIQHHFGARLERVEGHVAGSQKVLINGRAAEVNSYHRWGTRSCTPPLQAWAAAEDGVIKAVRHQALPVIGVMWHMERMSPARKEDIALVRSLFHDGQAH